MVDIAVEGLRVAGGSGAGLGTSAEQILELAAGDVAIFRVPVDASVPGDGLERDVQAAQELR